MATMKALLLIFASLEAVLALETAALVDDPCTYHVCQVGEVCKPVYNHLLQVPVAACHEVGTHHHSTGSCISHTVGANLMNCKTESDWRKICLNQCPMVGVPVLSDMTVNYACFSYSRNDVTFLQATCTCCQQVPTTPAPIATVTQQTTDGATATSVQNAKVVAANDDSRKDLEDALQIEPKDILYPLLIVGLVAAAVSTLGCVALVLRHRRKYSRLPSKTVAMVTSYENTGALVVPSPLVVRKGNNYTKLEDQQQPNSAPSPTPHRGYQKLVESYCPDE